MISHTGPIAGIATHGEWVATAGYDNRLILWSTSNQKAVAMGMHDHLVNNCAFSHDGQYLVSASSDYSARIWSVPSMRLLTVLADHQDDVDMAAFSPDDQLIATCALDRIVRIYDRRGICLQEFKGHTGNVLALAWTADGKKVISTSVDGTIRCWSIEAGVELSRTDLQVRTDSLEISSSGVIYAGDDLGRIAIIKDSDIHFYSAHQAGIKKVVLDECKSQLICLSYDGWMSVWNISTGEPTEINRSPLPDCVWARSAAVASDGSIVAGTFGSTYAKFNPATNTWDNSGVQAGDAINAVHVTNGHVYTIGDAGELRRDGQVTQNMGSLCNFIASADAHIYTGGQVGELFNALTGEMLYKHHSPLNCGATYSSNGKQHLIIGTYTGELLVFSLSSDHAQLIKELKVYENAVKGISIARGQIFSVCANTSIAWHDLQTFEQLKFKDHAHEKIVNDCCMIDDQHFATISRDKTLKIWNGSGHESYESPHPNSIKCISISDDKRQLASGSYGGTVAVFDIDQRHWTQFERPTTSGISDITWDAAQQSFIASSYDGKLYPIHGH
jgi:WD40 repeat protein